MFTHRPRLADLQVTGGVPRMDEKVRKLSSCRLRRSSPFVLLNAGLSPRMWPQLASMRTFHRWLRVRLFGWPGATPRSAVPGIGDDPAERIP